MTLKNWLLVGMLACSFMTPSRAIAAIRSTWPVEHAVERAELIVLGTRGAEKGEYLEVIVDQVLHGESANKGETILVRTLGGFETTWHRHWGRRDGPGLDLSRKPIFLCLSRQAIFDKDAPANAFELQTTGSGTAVKIIDGHNVFGYYQWHNPGPYVLTREGGSRDELLRRVTRGIALGREWARIVAIGAEDPRHDAMVAFLADRTLPEHFCWQACLALSNARLVTVIRDEVTNVKDISREPDWDRESYPDEPRRTRLASALMWVKDDGKELLPLLQRIKTARPSHYDSAVRCAARVCGEQAIPFLRQAALDAVESDDTARGLCRIGTPEARTALETVLRKHLEDAASGTWSPTHAYAAKWPAAWKEFAAQLGKDHPADRKVQAYLKRSWTLLVEVKVFTTEDVPARYRP